MREIKFRAWDKKEMILTTSPGYLINFGGDLYTVDNVNGVTYYKRDDWILMQYTGLKDKNGKEIYEGDILIDPEPHWEHGGEKIHNSYGAVSFCEGEYITEQIGEKCLLIHTAAGFNNCEVIGNIYENPELLKV